MKWYDLFASFYDSSLERLYFDSRKRAAELLDPQPHQKILDLACGTGANFPHIKELSSGVSIYGTDFSTGMLDRAKVRVDKNNWENIHLFQSDARELNMTLIKEQTDFSEKFDSVLCILGLSVIPNWDSVLSNMLELLKENGRIIIVDVFAEKRTFNTWLVEKIARADLNRTIWQNLQPRVDHFHYEALPVKQSKVGGTLFVAYGTKSDD